MMRRTVAAFIGLFGVLQEVKRCHVLSVFDPAEASQMSKPPVPDLPKGHSLPATRAPPMPPAVPEPAHIAPFPDSSASQPPSPRQKQPQRPISPNIPPSNVPSLQNFISEGTGIQDSNFQKFIENKFQPLQSPSQSPSIEDKITDMEAQLLEAQTLIREIQAKKSSDIEQKFDQITHRQLEKLIPTVGEYQKSAEKLQLRDEQWRNTLAKEVKQAEDYYKEKSERDVERIKGQVVAEMKQTHAEDLAKLNAAIETSNRIRDGQMTAITQTVTQIQEVQDKLLGTIDDLRDVNALYGIIVKLEQAINSDGKKLPEAFDEVLTHAGKDEFVAATAGQTLEKVSPNQVPTLIQLEAEFPGMYTRARRAALTPSQTPYGEIASQVVDFFIPQNIRAIDNNDTLMHLRRAQVQLREGELKNWVDWLELLQGYAREKSREFVSRVQARLEVISLIEILLKYNESREDKST